LALSLLYIMQLYTHCSSYCTHVCISCLRSWCNNQCLANLALL